MSDLVAARLQMAVSLGFHILFAVAGIAMPMMMAIAEYRWLKTEREVWLVLAKRWARGTAILFAVGAVSGTVLSFALGLLWPRFMAFAGPIFGLPFAFEGFAFFTEAIFLGIFLYGWDRVSPWAHWASGVVVAASGAISGMFVVIANAWMNTPTGFTLQPQGGAGRGPIAADIDPVAAMMNPSALGQMIHMIVAAYAAVGLAVAGIHAFSLLRDPKSEFHRAALAVALVVGGTGALLEPLTGDIVARAVARTQPVKLAAMEGQFETEAGAPLRIGGVPDQTNAVTRYAIEIPYGLSFLVAHDPSAVIKGLKEFPRSDWPPVVVVHFAFQIMVGCGTAMAGIVALGVLLALKKRGLPDHPLYLKALVLCSPMGFLAIEAGWTVTEVGRQPWIIQGIMRTADAVTPVPGQLLPLFGIIALYAFLGAIVTRLMYHEIFSAPIDSKGAGL